MFKQSMTVTLHSTLHKTQHTFASKNGHVNLYFCGPTVYSDVHIGNVRGPLFFNLLTKLFNLHKISFTYYQNVTDIDDRIIEKAQKLQCSERVISERYFNEYKVVLKRLGCDLNRLRFIKVTNYMEAMINYIKLLIKQQFAYQTKNGVYFAVKRLSNYQNLTNSATVNYQQHSSKKVLSNHSIGQETTSALLNNNQYCCLTFVRSQGLTLDSTTTASMKEHCADFALWKLKISGQTWKSPWGDGRPGWHTECAVLINRLFPNALHLHGGGSDLIYPHHHNELAQFTALYGRQVKMFCWWHNGLVHVNKQKIAKSQPETSTLWLVKDFLNKYNSNILKLLFYSEVYENDLFITDKKINQNVLLDQKINNLLQKVQLELVLQHDKTLDQFTDEDATLWNSLVLILNNGLRTHLLIDEINTLLKQINTLLDKKLVLQTVPLVKTLLRCFNLLSLDYAPPNINNELKKSIFAWKSALLEENFAEADRIRQVLQQKKVLPIKKKL